MSEKSQTILNIVLCAVLVLIESLQALIVLVLVFSFIPLPIPPLVHQLFPRYLDEVKPEREILFYRFWVCSVLLGQTALLIGLKEHLSSPKLARRLGPFCGVEAAWLFLMIFASFKYFVYGYPPWALHVLYAVLAGSMFSKLFWREICLIAKTSFNYINEHPAVLTKVVDIFFPWVIVGLIFIPDMEALIARNWIGDNFIHMDTTLIGYVWAFLKGAILNIDVYVHYGVGMPIFTALIAKTFGIVSYPGIVSILVWATIIYFIGCYFFLRSWLNNVPLAVAGVLMAIKWQMFHPGNFPCVFNYPYSTVCRYFFDIIVLFLLLGHIRTASFKFLGSAAAVVGLALFYISDTGVYLFLAYIFYLCWLVVEAKLFKGNWKKMAVHAAACLAIVSLSAFIWFYIFEGTHLWSEQFWTNMSERIALFLAGHGDLPMYKSLVDGDYLVALMSFVIPLVYVGVMALTLSLMILKKIDRKHILVAVLCVYGLGLYHYYVVRSAGTAYDTVCIPFVFVLCWLLYSWGKSLAIHLRRGLWGITLVIAIFALVSNHAFLSYPNIFNCSRNPIVHPMVKWPNKDISFYFNNQARNINPALKLPLNSLGEKDEFLRIETDFKTDQELKDYFKSEYDYAQDAALIDSLTSKDQGVPLISSFETRILMQADRKPFFYYFPFIDSSPRRMRIFPFTRLWTTHSLDVTMKQFEERKPPFVFMEKIMLTNQVPQIYEYLYPELLYILSYLDKNYKPYRYGQYLVALKRNP